MATDKPKIQGYILPKLYDRFEEWKSDRRITKDSQALNQLFSEFFGVSTDPASAPSPDQLEETITSIVEERLSSVNGIVGELQLKVRSLSEQLEELTQAVTAMQSAGGLSRRLQIEIPSRLPVQGAITDVNQAPSDSQVSQSEVSTVLLSATLERGTNESPSNLPSDLSAETPESHSHIEAAGELLNEIQGESLGQAVVTKETLEPTESESQVRLHSDLLAATPHGQPEPASDLPVNQIESLPLATQETLLKSASSESQTNLISELSADTSEIYISSAGKLQSELPGELVEQTRFTDAQEISSVDKNELLIRLPSDSVAATPDSQPEANSNLLVNHNELLSTATEETDLEPSLSELPSDFSNELPLDTLDSQPQESMPVGVSHSSSEILSESLTPIQLAKRLGVNPSTLTRQKGKDRFSDWIKGKDPDGVAWRYDSKSKQFHPVERECKL